MSGNSISLNEVMITLHYPRDFLFSGRVQGTVWIFAGSGTKFRETGLFEVDEAVKKTITAEIR